MARALAAKDAGPYFEANGGEGIFDGGRSASVRAALILRAAASYQGSFWKLRLRGGRLAFFCAAPEVL
jgi:hypothetical protein